MSSAPDTAECENNTVVSLRLPADIRERGRYLASISELRVEPDQRAVVTINDRTGTVVIGHNVRLSGVALSHGSLTIVTSENPTVSSLPRLVKARPRRFHALTLR